VSLRVVRQDGVVLNELRHRLRLLLWSCATLGLTVASLVLFVLTITGTALVIVWIGIPILLVTISLTKGLANLRRRYSGGLAGRELPSPYLRRHGGGLLSRIAKLAADPAVRRDVVWLLVDGTLGIVLSALALVEGILDLIFWWLPAGLFVRIHARIDAALLDQSEKSRLAQRVEQLTESRAESVDTQAAELRRIERDLHDGAQARLVSLGMSLAMAEEQLERDPEAARALLAEARTTSSAALSELRDLVRGIHPPVLADRGLIGAVQALAMAAPIPVSVHAVVRGRLPAPVESAGYFAIAEGLTNVIKHSRASSASIEISDDGTRLRLEVRDDGAGGADPAQGTGLRGIERRLSVFDGTLNLQSPSGEGTDLVMVLPCAPDSAPSSPKTLPSSGTA
jgi:signal transduction histidine kinase